MRPRHGKVLALDWSKVEPINTRTTFDFPSVAIKHRKQMEPPPTSPEESPTRYRLPDHEEEGKGLVDYSLNPHSPAKYPLRTKKRKKTDKTKKNKKLKQEPGKRVHFHTKVTVKLIQDKRHYSMQEVALSCEDDYPLRNSDFALKRQEQKLILKLQHQRRPFGPRRRRILERLEKENNLSSVSQTQTNSPPSTPSGKLKKKPSPTNLIPMLSSTV